MNPEPSGGRAEQRLEALLLETLAKAGILAPPSSCVTLTRYLSGHASVLSLGKWDNNNADFQGCGWLNDGPQTLIPRTYACYLIWQNGCHTCDHVRDFEKRRLF